MSGDRPDLHTPEHDQWDQGGYCNNLVTDHDGTGTICGYHAPRRPQENEILTPLGGAVRTRLLPPHLVERINGDENGTLLVMYVPKIPWDQMSGEIVLSEQNRRDLAAQLLRGLDAS